jgi:hypothetical protein
MNINYTDEEMFNIISHERDAKQDNNEIFPHIYLNR